MNVLFEKLQQELLQEASGKREFSAKGVLWGNIDSAFEILAKSQVSNIVREIENMPIAGNSISGDKRDFITNKDSEVVPLEVEVIIRRKR